jgi:hypothetical protein
VFKEKWKEKGGYPVSSLKRKNIKIESSYPKKTLLRNISVIREYVVVRLSLDLLLYHHHLMVGSLVGEVSGAAVVAAA